jgi:hypothetical protein
MGAGIPMQIECSVEKVLPMLWCKYNIKALVNDVLYDIIMAYIINKGFDVVFASQHGKDLFNRALYLGKVEILQMLFETARIIEEGQSLGSQPPYMSLSTRIAG